MCVGVSGGVPIVPFHTFWAVGSLKLRQSVGFEKDNVPKKENSSWLVVGRLRGGSVLGGGAWLRDAGKRRNGWAA